MNMSQALGLPSCDAFLKLFYAKYATAEGPCPTYRQRERTGLTFRSTVIVDHCVSRGHHNIILTSLEVPQLVFTPHPDQHQS